MVLSILNRPQVLGAIMRIYLAGPSIAELRRRSGPEEVMSMFGDFSPNGGVGVVVDRLFCVSERTLPIELPRAGDNTDDVYLLKGSIIDEFGNRTQDFLALMCADLRGNCRLLVMVELDDAADMWHMDVDTMLARFSTIASAQFISA